jgi:outer membrane protein OmpA-like peptidoglycan-associated protein
VTEARGRADRAQTTADAAQSAAKNAQSTADNATAKATQVNQRVDTLVQNIDAYTLSRTVTVTFKVNQAILTPEAMADLDALVAELQGKKGFVLDIQGYTDSTGGNLKNQQLSDRRARAVYQYLAEHGMPLFRMNLLGFGKGQPIADNTTREGRAQNRRVEVRLMVNSLKD